MRGLSSEKVVLIRGKIATLTASRHCNAGMSFCSAFRQLADIIINRRTDSCIIGRTAEEFSPTSTALFSFITAEEFSLSTTVMIK